LVVLVIVLTATWFIPAKPGFALRNEVAYWLVKLDRFELSEDIYTYSAEQGDLRAHNNLHVLNYRKERYAGKISSRTRRRLNAQYKQAFEDLSEKGLGVASYNRALFDYRCSPKKPCYESGKRMFERAVEQGDNFGSVAYALHLTRKPEHADSENWEELVKSAADRGEPEAAYRMAWMLGFKTDDDSKAMKKHYAKIAARGGSSNAQELYSRSLDPPAQLKWLKRAANNRTNPHPDAASLLGHFYKTGKDDVKIDYEKARKWYAYGMTLTKPYRHRLVAGRDGLRWRPLNGGFPSPNNSAHFTGYNYALMHYWGLGGPKDLDGFEKHMRFAAKKKIKDSELILMQLQQARDPIPDEDFNSQKTAWAVKLFGKRISRKHPYIQDAIKDGRLHVASFLDIQGWKEQGLVIRENEYGSGPGFNRMTGIKPEFIFNRHLIMTEKLILPADMYGGSSEMFIIPEGVGITALHGSSNSYTFLGKTKRKLKSVEDLEAILEAE